MEYYHNNPIVNEPICSGIDIGPFEFDGDMADTANALGCFLGYLAHPDNDELILEFKYGFITLCDGELEDVWRTGGQKYRVFGKAWGVIDTDNESDEGGFVFENYDCAKAWQDHYNERK